MTRLGKRKELAERLLTEYGKTYAEELSIPLHTNTASALFQWWCASLLMSARIRTPIAVSAANALFESGWTTAEKLDRSTWKERVQSLNHAGYARYDESAARMLGGGAARILQDYGGDLRELRERAGRNPIEERRLLKEFMGIGDVGADIFLREVQVAWEEVYPFAGSKALRTGLALGLGRSADEIAALVDRADYARLIAALIRVALQRNQSRLVRI